MRAQGQLALLLAALLLVAAAARRQATNPGPSAAATVMVFALDVPSGTPAGNGGQLPWDDDTALGPFTLPSPLTVFGQEKTKFYVTTNAIITFDYDDDGYTPTGFSEVDQAVFGLYWTDSDLSGECTGTAPPDCNTATWRLSTPTVNQGDLVTAQTFLRTPGLPDYVIIATYKNVGYYSDRTDKLNTYQMMIARYGATTWVGYFYDKLEWDAGETADGSIDGIWQGGPEDDPAAYAGFGAGSTITPPASMRSQLASSARSEPKPKKKVMRRSKGQPRQGADALVYLNLPGSGTGAIRELVNQFGGTAADSLPLVNGQWVWDTIHLAGCAAFGSDLKACCGQCIPSTLNCNTVPGCAADFECSGGACCDQGWFKPDNSFCWGRVRVWHDAEGVYHDDTMVARTCQGRCRSGSCIISNRDLDQCFA